MRVRNGASPWIPLGPSCLSCIDTCMCLYTVLCSQQAVAFEWRAVLCSVVLHREVALYCHTSLGYHRTPTASRRVSPSSSKSSVVA